jgi:hypothetical protein
MFGVAFYVGICLVIAGAVTLVHSLMRPVHSKGESKSWKVLFTVFVICLTGPYGYIEVLTRSVGKDLKRAVEEGYADSGIQGPLQYFKVISYSGNKARVVVVGTERESWGGTDRPVVALTLVKDGSGWHSDSFNVVYSDRLNKDRSTMPPYW